MHWKTITAIGALMVLESIALLTGHNGTMYTLTIIAISGLGGYHMKITKESLEKIRENPSLYYQPPR